MVEAVEFFETVLHADVDGAGTPVEDERTRLLRTLACLHEKTANRRDAVVFAGGVGGKGESEVDAVVSGDYDVVAARHAHDAVEVPRLLEIRPVGLHREGLHVDRDVLVVPGKNGGRTVFHRENEVVVDNDAVVRDVRLLRGREGSGCGTENRKGNDRLSKERAKRLFRKKSFRSGNGRRRIDVVQLCVFQKGFPVYRKRFRNFRARDFTKEVYPSP